MAWGGFSVSGALPSIGLVALVGFALGRAPSVVVPVVLRGWSSVGSALVLAERLGGWMWVSDMASKRWLVWWDLVLFEIEGQVVSCSSLSSRWAGLASEAVGDEYGGEHPLSYDWSHGMFHVCSKGFCVGSVALSDPGSGYLSLHELGNWVWLWHVLEGCKRVDTGW